MLGSHREEEIASVKKRDTYFFGVSDYKVTIGFPRDAGGFRFQIEQTRVQISVPTPAKAVKDSGGDGRL